MKNTINHLEQLLIECQFGSNDNMPQELGIEVQPNLSSLEKVMFDHNSQCFRSQMFGAMSLVLGQNIEVKAMWNRYTKEVREWVPLFMESRLRLVPDSLKEIVEAAVQSNLMGLCFEMYYESELNDEFFYRSTVLPLLEQNRFVGGWKKRVGQNDFLKRNQTEWLLDLSSFDKTNLIVF